VKTGVEASPETSAVSAIPQAMDDVQHNIGAMIQSTSEALREQLT